MVETEVPTRLDNSVERAEGGRSSRSCEYGSESRG